MMTELVDPFCQKFIEVNQPLFYSTHLADFARYCRSGSLWAEPPECMGTLTDRADLFWNQELGSPLMHGPITLVFNCDAFRCMDRIRIARKTELAGKTAGPGKNLNAESLYQEKILKEEFWEVEVDLTSIKLPLPMIKYVLVAPMIVAGKELKDWVWEVAELANAGMFRPQKMVRRRSLRDTNSIQGLMDWVLRENPLLKPAPSDFVEGLPESLRPWFKSLDEIGRERFATWVLCFQKRTLNYLDEIRSLL